jgi:origin recognition complex subunit 4
LSILGVCLVVAIGQLLSNQMATFNFEMVYDEYREFLQKQMRMGRGMGQLHFAKPVALKVFKD